MTSNASKGKCTFVSTNNYCKGMKALFGGKNLPKKAIMPKKPSVQSKKFAEKANKAKIV
jgi:hypothetical protein